MSEDDPREMQDKIKAAHIRLENTLGTPVSEWAKKYGEDHYTLVMATLEALDRYPEPWDHSNNVPVDDWGYSEEQRTAFVAGALYEAKRSASERGWFD